MTFRYRVIWLPRLAILLPCLFMAGLSYRWLALEREAAAHRGAEAAQRVADDLRKDLAGTLRAAAETSARTLAELPPTRPPFQALPTLPPLISQAYLFDASGHLLAPRHDSVDTEAYRRGRSSQTASASKEVDGRAAFLLDRARQSLAAGRLVDADRHAREIAICCAGARDEYGVSFVLYAAWLRVAAYKREAHPDRELAALTGELRGLLAQGHLGAPSDSTQLKLLAAKANNCAPLSDLAWRVEQTVAAFVKQKELGALAAGWVAASGVAGPSDTAPTLIGPLGRGAPASAAMLLRMTAGDSVVAVINLDGVTQWVARWAAEHEPFKVVLRLGGAGPIPPGTVGVQLFPTAPAAATLLLRAPGTDPDADRSRRRVFIATAMVVLALTMSTGYLAARDVSRELHTATLRSTFVAGVTHELKTPLASIRLLAQTLRQGRARAGVADELLGTIVEETDRLGRLVDNVLSSSKMESGTRTFNPQLVLLGEAVRKAIARFAYVLTKEGFTVVDTVDGADVLVRVDREALEQAVLNLLSNAVKYSGASREICVKVGHGLSHASVSVVDKGIGVARAHRERIFDSFYRVPQAGFESAGAGLGLALVRHFAEAHGGHVAVNSELWRGSVFSIVLPLPSTPHKPV